MVIHLVRARYAHPEKVIPSERGGSMHLYLKIGLPIAINVPGDDGDLVRGVVLDQELTGLMVEFTGNEGEVVIAGHSHLGVDPFKINHIELAAVDEIQDHVTIGTSPGFELVMEDEGVLAQPA